MIVVEALVPIFLLILLGYLLRIIPSKDAKSGKIKPLFADKFWSDLERFIYYILMPALLIYKLSSANTSLEDGYIFVTVSMFTILAVLILLIAINYFIKFDAKSFTSIVQGSIRFNTYVFLALIYALLGDSGLFIAAFLITFLIPFLNVVCITIFSLYIEGDEFRFKTILLQIVKNPLIIGCFIGGMLNFLDLSLPLVLNEFLKILSSAALPLGLLSVGVGLRFSNIKDAKKELMTALFFKLFYLPFIAYILGTIVGLNTIMLMVLVIFSSMPTATSSYILARTLKGDEKLMSSIITLQTLVGMFTISVIVYQLGL